jgi:hypothetical protein
MMVLEGGICILIWHRSSSSLSLFFLGILCNCKVKPFPKIFHKTSELSELFLVILRITSEPIFWIMLSAMRNL